jgi:hypothetical protein
MQSDLFLVRRSDPSTSKAAAAIAQSLSGLQLTVLNWLKCHRGSTDLEMVEAIRKVHGGSESTWRTRRSELVELGLVRCLGEVKIGKRKHQTWVAL